MSWKKPLLVLAVAIVTLAIQLLALSAEARDAARPNVAPRARVSAPGDPQAKKDGAATSKRRKAATPAPSPRAKSSLSDRLPGTRAGVAAPHAPSSGRDAKLSKTLSGRLSKSGPSWCFRIVGNCYDSSMLRCGPCLPADSSQSGAGWRCYGVESACRSDHDLVCGCYLGM